MPESKDYYKILQVSKQATSEEIKAAFRRLARQYHPDLNPDDKASSEKFREICEAYEALSEANGSYQGDRNPRNQANGQLSDRHFYVQGVEKALQKDYQGALDRFNQAIKLNPRFFEAYLKRCEVRYKLGDDRGVLEDCHQILQINSCPQAYYHQGRSRLRLGYPESAIEAYTEAIRLEDNYAQAYYYRGLAYQELKATASAVKDIQTAAQKFRSQGDLSGYQLATATLKNLNKGWNIGIVTKISSTLGDAVKALTIIVNPGGGLLPAFARLVPEQAAVTGIVYGIIANLGFLGGCALGLSGLGDYFSLGLIGMMPFVSLVVTSAIARFVFGRRGGFAGDIFLAGATVLPLGLLALVFPVLPLSFAVIASVFACCYTILLLYSGCTQISNLSEAKAAFVVPVILVISSWLFYQALTSVIEISL